MNMVFFRDIMLSGKEELTGGYRLAHVRRAKRYLYLTEVVVLIAAVVAVLLLEGRISLVPFYLPLNSFIYFVLLMGLIILVESYVFRALEMRLIKSASTKFYICKMGIRRAMFGVVICVVVILLLWLPFVHVAVEETLATEGSLANTHDVAATSVVGFYDRDPLGISAVSEIDVTANGGTARVYVVSEQNFKNHGSDVTKLAVYRVNTYQYIVNQQLTIDVGELPFGKYYLVLDTRISTATSVDYTITSAMSPTFLSYVPMFALFFAIANLAWIVYLTPLKKRYAEGAIYR